ncbi:MAG: hypothetical protein FWF46_01745 [Oscillospiraceae bacterium]|nr:hypothetical protein [Oscillospiraceae bacterium]
MMKKRMSIKKKIILVCVLVIALSFASVFARYVLDKYNDFFSKSKEFYFSSDKLSTNMPTYKIEDWESGINMYTINVNMSSWANELLHTPYNINYSISLSNVSDEILCSLSKTSGTIDSSIGTDDFTITVRPNTPLNVGDVVSFQVTATSTDPYQKTLGAKFYLTISSQKVSYQITDSANSPYLELEISNTLSVNAQVSLSFDPNTVLLDMTNDTYLNATNATNTVIGTYNYVNGFTFNLKSMTSTKIRFYKVDSSKNYTNTSIIGISSQ